MSRKPSTLEFHSSYLNLWTVVELLVWAIVVVLIGPAGLLVPVAYYASRHLQTARINKFLASVPVHLAVSPKNIEDIEVEDAR